MTTSSATFEGVEMPREGFFSEADVKMVPECSVAIEKAYQIA